MTSSQFTDLYKVCCNIDTKVSLEEYTYDLLNIMSTMGYDGKSQEFLVFRQFLKACYDNVQDWESMGAMIRANQKDFSLNKENVV